MVKVNNARLIITLIGLSTLFVILVRLGFWQLERAEFKRSYLKQLAQRQAQVLTQLPSREAGELNKQSINLTGTLLYQFTLLLDNKVEQGVVGYQVLVPFLVNDAAQSLILVNLGWVKANLNRSILPQLSQWHGEVTIAGYLHQPSDNPFTSASQHQPEWPRVIAKVDFALVEKWFESMELAGALFPAVLRVNEQQLIGYKKHWRWTNGMTVAKHQGYAMQWFALALTLLVLTAYFAYRTSRRGYGTGE